MGYQKIRDSAWANTEDVTLVAPGTVITATGSTAAWETGNRSCFRLTQAVTAASGTTPSLTTVIETAETATGPWRACSSTSTFTAATGVTSQRLSFGGADRWVRATYTVSGTTPSLTLGIFGESV